MRSTLPDESFRIQWRIGDPARGRILGLCAAAPHSSSRLRYRDLELKVAALQKDYAELHTELAEAAQVHRRLCAPRLVQCGNFEIASETFAVRHVPGDFFTIEETSNRRNPCSG